MHPLRLALVRLVRGGTGLGLLAAVVGTATAGVLLGDSYQVGLQRAAMGSSMAALAPAERTVSASFDGPDERVEPAYEAARKAIAALSGTASIQSAAASRPMWDGTSTTVQLAAVDDIAAHVRLDSGRLPRKCAPAECEVVLIGDEEPTLAGFRMIAVGRGKIIDSSPLLQLLDPAATTAVAGNPAVVRAMPQVSAMGSSVVWSAPLSPQAIVNLSSSWLAEVQRRSSELSLVDSHLVLRVPDSEIRQASQQAGAAARRLEGMGLALCLVAAGTAWRVVSLRRRDIQAVAIISAQLGRPAHPSAGVMAVAAAVSLGLLVGAVAAPAVTLLADLPLPRSRAWVLACTCAIVCIVVGAGRLSKWLTLGGALTIVGTAGLGYAWSPQAYSLAVPVAACAAAALAIALGPLATAGWRSPMTRVHAANMARPLAAATAVCAFACASVTAVVTQGSALSDNAADQATFTSPLAVRLSARTESPLGSADRADFESATASAAYPVLRLPATARAGSLAAETVQVIGIDASALATMRDVSRQTGAPATDYLRLHSSSDISLGTAVATTAPLRIQATGLDSHSDLLVWLYDGEGGARTSTCIRQTKTLCEAALPSESSQVSMVGFTVQEDPNSRARREHAAGEGAHEVGAPRGTVVISSVADSGGDVPIGSGAITISYDLARGPAYRPLVTAPSAIPALVDADTAASLPAVLTLRPTVDVAITPIASLRRFPTAPARFAVIDFTTLAAALATVDPTLLNASEVWLKSDIADASPLVAGVSLVRQSDIRQALDGSAARTWTTAATATTGALMLLVIALVASALAKHTAAELPYGTWRLLGVRRTRYLRGALLTAGRQVAVICLLSALAATAIANTLVRASGLDVMGRVATPPIAPAWPWQVVTASTLVTAVAFLCVFGISMSRWTERDD